MNAFTELKKSYALEALLQEFHFKTRKTRNYDTDIQQSTINPLGATGKPQHQHCGD